MGITCFLTANSENIVLNTILNRCLKFYFEDYTIEELKELTQSNPLQNDLIYSVCKTPGKLKNMSDKSFESLFEQSYRLVACVQEMTYPQILVYKELINLKEEYNKIDFVAFFDMVEYLAYENYKSNASEANFNIYKITNQKNGMVYIGSSIEVERRWRQHKEASINEKDHHYNYPLMIAFREFGIANFTFEVIDDTATFWNDVARSASFSLFPLCSSL